MNLGDVQAAHDARESHRMTVRLILRWIAFMVTLFVLVACVRLGATFWWHHEPNVIYEWCTDGTSFSWPSTTPDQRLQNACTNHQGANPNG